MTLNLLLCHLLVLPLATSIGTLTSGQVWLSAFDKTQMNIKEPPGWNDGNFPHEITIWWKSNCQNEQVFHQTIWIKNSMDFSETMGISLPCSWIWGEPTLNTTVLIKGLLSTSGKSRQKQNTFSNWFGVMVLGLASHTQDVVLQNADMSKSSGPKIHASFGEFPVYPIMGGRWWHS